MRRMCGKRATYVQLFIYLSHGLVRVCEIELSHIGKNNGNPDLVSKNILSWMQSFMRRESELTSSLALMLQIQWIMAHLLHRRQFNVSAVMANTC